MEECGQGLWRAEAVAGQRSSWPGSGRYDGDHPDIRGSAELPHDSEPSPSYPSDFQNVGRNHK
jgi:hypothetical protein